MPEMVVEAVIIQAFKRLLDRHINMQGMEVLAGREEHLALGTAQTLWT